MIRGFLTFLEYTPLGFIPGSMRLAALNKDEGKIHDLAMKYLKPANQPISERTRGILSCIPIVSTFTLPIIDIIHNFSSKNISPTHSTQNQVHGIKINKLDAKKIAELEKAKAAAEVMALFYQEAFEAKEQNKLSDNTYEKPTRTYLLDKYSSEKVDVIQKEKEWRKAVFNAHKFSQAYFKNDLPYYKLPNYNNPKEFLKDYDTKIFMSCLENFADKMNPQLKYAKTRPFLFLECTADCGNPAGAMYLRKYHQNFIHDINLKINELSSGS